MNRQLLVKKCKRILVAALLGGSLLFGYVPEYALAVTRAPVPVQRANPKTAPKKKVVVKKKAVVKKSVTIKKATTISAPSAEPVLTVPGVLSWTNTARNQNGLEGLSESLMLDRVASARLKDLFAKQYFDHNSPTGETPGDVAATVGYQFINFGENIAMGYYADDKALVDAWMKSPHHRENILQPRFQEIGIAVGEGWFKGKLTWIAVQNFGRPLSACPHPDPVLKNNLDEKAFQLHSLKLNGNRLRAALASSTPATQAEIDTYNQTVAEYNNLVPQINGLVDELKTLTDSYNAQIAVTNRCMSQ